MNPYRERYRNELRELMMDTAELFNLVDMALADSLIALRDYDAEIARQVIKNDQIVDDLNLNVEKRCTELLALQQPMAKDLRRIIGVLKIGIELERIGDLAVDIARTAIANKDKVHVKPLKNIPHMAEIAREMLAESARALENDDASLARQITTRDYEIDNLYVKVRDMLFSIMVENPHLIDDATPLVLANRHLERIGDHICNICESIVYMVEGKREHLN
jgi:phosphate transport system protein